MEIEKLLNITKGKILNKYKNKKIKKIKIDTRILEKGDCFIAITGKNLDGHDYINEAINKKASVLIVEKEVNIKTNIPIIKVKSTMKVLLDISKYYKEKYEVLYIGITGSNGKTTTKELISTILSKKYNILKTEKNYNNKIGIPLTLLNLSNKHEIAIIEMGMNHKGEIKELTELIKPDIGIITNIGTSHLEYLKTKKNIFKAKMEITAGIKDGILLVNGDDKHLKKLKNTLDYDVIKAGFKSNYGLIPYDIKSNIEDLNFKLFYQNKEYEIKTNLIGDHFIIDIMLAIETALLFDLTMEEIVNALYSYKTTNRRMSITKTKDFTIIDDCYNANVESFMALIKLIKNDENKKIVIAGDMLELGKHSKKAHKKIIKNLKRIKNADIYLVGENMKVGKNKLKHFANNKEIINYFKIIDKNYFKNKVIILKASRGIYLEEIKKFINNL